MHTIFVTFLVIAATAAFGGCGGGSSDVVARVGSTPITTVELNHWMSTLAGGDYFEITAATIPRGVVAEPENLPLCISKLKTIALGKVKYELRHRCQQLYSLLKEQAVEYLINSDVYAGEDAEQGATVSNHEIRVALASDKGEEFPTPATLQQYLAERDWSFSDEMFIEKRDLLGTKLLQKVHEKLGSTASEEAIDQYYKALARKWHAKTSCNPGYVVSGCKEYRKPATPPTLSPAIVMEEIRGGK
jgi:hypothetical protein